jgi:hypothetical protein
MTNMNVALVSYAVILRMIGSYITGHLCIGGNMEISPNCTGVCMNIQIYITAKFLHNNIQFISDSILQLA